VKNPGTDLYLGLAPGVLVEYTATESKIVKNQKLLQALVRAAERQLHAYTKCSLLDYRTACRETNAAVQALLNAAEADNKAEGTRSRGKS
jgi:hypothetical protein